MVRQVPGLPGAYRMEAGGRVYSLHLPSGIIERVAVQRKGKFGPIWLHLKRGGPAFVKACELWEKEA